MPAQGRTWRRDLLVGALASCLTAVILVPVGWGAIRNQRQQEKPATVGALQPPGAGWEASAGSWRCAGSPGRRMLAPPRSPFATPSTPPSTSRGQGADWRSIHPSRNATARGS